MEEILLSRVVPLPEHDVVPERSFHIKVDLTNVRRELPAQHLHRLVLPHLLLLNPVQI